MDSPNAELQEVPHSQAGPIRLTHQAPLHCLFRKARMAESQQEFFTPCRAQAD
uniref:Uncharacterized protein n=1 Tax=Anguilla anguilla TaxID=7936 RepID=A0A0E9UTB7_ANGAN